MIAERNDFVECTCPKTASLQKHCTAAQHSAPASASSREEAEGGSKQEAAVAPSPCVPTQQHHQRAQQTIQAAAAASHPGYVKDAWAQSQDSASTGAPSWRPQSRRRKSDSQGKRRRQKPWCRKQPNRPLPSKRHAHRHFQLRKPAVILYLSWSKETSASNTLSRHAARSPASDSGSKRLEASATPDPRDQPAKSSVQRDDSKQADPTRSTPNWTRLHRPCDTKLREGADRKQTHDASPERRPEATRTKDRKPGPPTTPEDPAKQDRERTQPSATPYPEALVAPQTLNPRDVCGVRSVFFTLPTTCKSKKCIATALVALPNGFPNCSVLAFGSW